jgi:hypothetical protein
VIAMKKVLVICLMFVFVLLFGFTGTAKTIAKTDEIKTIFYEEHAIIGDYLVTVTGSGPNKEIAKAQAKAMINWVRVGFTKDGLEILAKKGISLKASFSSEGKAELRVAYGYVIDKVIQRGVSFYLITVTGSGPNKEIAKIQAEKMMELAQKLSQETLDRLAKEGSTLSLCFLCTAPNGEAELYVSLCFLGTAPNGEAELL